MRWAAGEIREDEILGALRALKAPRLETRGELCREWQRPA
jgi:hypothetical protein